MEQVVIETYLGATLHCKWELIPELIDNGSGLVSGFKINDIDGDYSELLSDDYPSNKGELLENLSYLLNESDDFHHENDEFSIVYYKPTFSLEIDDDSFSEPELILTLNCHSDLARKIELASGWNGGEPEWFESGSQAYKLDRGAILSTLLVLHNMGFEEV